MLGGAIILAGWVLVLGARAIVRRYREPVLGVDLGVEVRR